MPREFAGALWGAGRFKPGLLKLPTGKWTLAGSVPVELCELKKNRIGQEYYEPRIFDTREEAEKALAIALADFRCAPVAEGVRE